jgi:hypothetical protein
VNKVLSEVLFNRALIWLVMASMVDDNSWLKGAYLVLAVFNVAKSLRAYAEDA